MAGVGHTSGSFVILKTGAFHGVKEVITMLTLDRVFARVEAAIAFATESGWGFG